MAVWSEVKVSAVATQSESFRIEAEFYQPKYLEAYGQLATCGIRLQRLGQLCERITDGSHVTPEYQEAGIPFLMVRDVREEAISFALPRYITPECDRSLRHCKPKAGDILLTKVGTLGLAATVSSDDPEFNIFVSLAVLKGFSGVDPLYVSAFLNSRFGRMQSYRQAKGITQPDLHLQEIRQFLIPVPSESVQLRVASLVKDARGLRQDAFRIYAEAETLLLRALGFELGDLAQEVAYERAFREVARAERFDSQYYHPEKQRVVEQLAVLEGSLIGAHFQNVEDVVTPPEKDTGETVQNYDLTDALRFFLDDLAPTPTIDLGSNKKRFRKGDIVVSRLRSYLREIAVVETEGNCVGSTEFIVLRRRNAAKVGPELLLVYLRAQPVQRILKWCQDGSQHPRFKDEELLAIKLPDRLLSVQDKIMRLVRAALDANKESKRLISESKRLVEEMIMLNKSQLGGEITE